MPFRQLKSFFKILIGVQYECAPTFLFYHGSPLSSILISAKVYGLFLCTIPSCNFPNLRL